MALNPQQIQALIRQHKRRDMLFDMLGLAVMLLAILVLFALFAQLVIDGASRLNLDFFTHFPSRRAAQAGILSAWVGSVAVMFVTALAAVPVGVAAGIYLEEYSGKGLLAEIIEVNVSNLAGVPSIIYGLLALGLLVYQIGLGESILTAGLTLAMLILPIVIVSTRESIRAVPNSIREAAYALGATRWQTVRDHVLPYSSAGIMTGVIIGLSRAIGETAPIITIGADGHRRAAVLQPRLAVLAIHRDADPDVQLDFASRPAIPCQCRCCRRRAGGNDPDDERVRHLAALPCAPAHQMVIR